MASRGTHFLDTLPKIPCFRPPFFCIELKNKAHRPLAGFLLFPMTVGLEINFGGLHDDHPCREPERPHRGRV